MPAGADEASAVLAGLALILALCDVIPRQSVKGRLKRTNLRVNEIYSILNAHEDIDRKDLAKCLSELQVVVQESEQLQPLADSLFKRWHPANIKAARMTNKRCKEVENHCQRASKNAMDRNFARRISSPDGAHPSHESGVALSTPSSSSTVIDVHTEQASGLVPKSSPLDTAGPANAEIACSREHERVDEPVHGSDPIPISKPVDTKEATPVSRSDCEDMDDLLLCLCVEEKPVPNLLEDASCGDLAVPVMKPEILPPAQPLLIRISSRPTLRDDDGEEQVNLQATASALAAALATGDGDTPRALESLPLQRCRAHVLKAPTEFRDLDDLKGLNFDNVNIDSFEVSEKKGFRKLTGSAAFTPGQLFDMIHEATADDPLVEEPGSSQPNRRLTRQRTMTSLISLADD
ncbi:hypothetical protein BD626DRAFT_584604 [Schizophyllum amplum]|uniref:Uncharacterized protein n=1 Tax=Schizophyllum amplum TaxID=97359 RepID=A0A550C8X6_9AGAR|nr:hypothetical protein BD626DRAFT_584604 [Auriculariopsis ampla]